MDDFFPPLLKENIVFENEHTLQTIDIGLLDAVPVGIVAPVPATARVAGHAMIRHVLTQTYRVEPLLGLFKAIGPFDVDAGLKYMVTGLVLLIFGSIDALTRRRSGAGG